MIWGTGGERRTFASSSRFFHLFEFSDGVILSQFTRAMEDGQGSIEIPMDLHLDPDIVAAVSIRRDLQGHPLEADTVVSVDCPFEVFAEDVIDISA